MPSNYQLSEPHVTLESAQEPAKSLLQSAQDAMGFVPNMYQGMAIAPGMLSTYMHGYEQFRENSGFSPAEQEVVLLTISRYHECGYCMSAHSMLADKMSNVPEDVLGALRAGEPLPEPKLQALSLFVQKMVESRGNPSEADVSDFLSAGFSEDKVLQIILAIAVKTLSNYGNHVTKPAVDEAFSAYEWNS